LAAKGFFYYKIDVEGIRSDEKVKKLSTLTGIQLVVGPIPAAFLLSGIIFARFFPLSREDHLYVLKVLATPRSTVDLEGSNKEVL
jgi:glycoside/pentoside/hexuronide:cation symporter, GPH family